MRILIICDSFYPKRNAPANRFLSLISHWSVKNNISLITKDTKKEDLNKIKNIININNFHLITSHNYVKGNNLFKKILNLLLFFVSSLFNIFTLKNKKFDVVLCSSPSLITLILGYIASKKFKSEYILEIRDIWSESLRDLGIIKSKAIIYLICKYEYFFYYKAKKIICVSSNIKNKIDLKEKCFVFTNFASIDIIKSKLFDKNLISKKIDYNNIKLLYLGTVGLSHEFEKIFKCLHNFNNFELNIVGDGLQKNKINKNIIKNINFFDQTYELKNLYNFYKISDFVLILLKDINVFKTVIPSKIFEYAYLNKIIIYLGPKNEASYLINKYNIGFCAHNIDELTNIFKYISDGNINITDYHKNFEKFNNEFSTFDISQNYINEILSK